MEPEEKAGLSQKGMWCTIGIEDRIPLQTRKWPRRIVNLNLTDGCAACAMNASPGEE